MTEPREDRDALPDDVDARLRVEIEGCAGGHYLHYNPHTFTGRIGVWCETTRQFTRISKSDIVEMSSEAELWLAGFLCGNEPPPWFEDPEFDYDESDPRTELWREAVAMFRRTGFWKTERACEVCSSEILPSLPGDRCSRHLGPTTE